MRIKNLHLENFRGFEKLDIEFPEDSNVVVFIGENGSGKTSILDILACHIGVVFNKKSNIQITKDDVSNSIIGKPLPLINDVIKYLDFSTEVLFLDAMDVKYGEKDNLPIRIWLGLDTHFNSTLIKVNNSFDNISKILYIRQKYSTERYISCYYNMKRDYDTTYSEFTNWFKEEVELENQTRLESNINYRSSKLEYIREILATFLSNLDEKANYKNLTIKRERKENSTNFKGNNIESYLKIDKNNNEIKLSQLSSGEKDILLLIVDIAKQVVNISNQYSIQHASGIILIDEIDLHLHPKWQRNILPALTKTFPNIQFIVTTHSPQVLSNIPKNSVFLLENNQLSDKDIYTEGRDSNSILQDAFGVAEIEEKHRKELQEIYTLIDVGNASAAQEKLEKLIEKRGENDREIVRMKSYIDFL